MDIATILTVKEPALRALVEVVRLYMEQDECVCDANADLPLFAGSGCPPDCEQCMWCIGRTALRGIGQRVEEA